MRTGLDFFWAGPNRKKTTKGGLGRKAGLARALDRLDRLIAERSTVGAHPASVWTILL